MNDVIKSAHKIHYDRLKNHSDKWFSETVCPECGEMNNSDDYYRCCNDECRIKLYLRSHLEEYDTPYSINIDLEPSNISFYFSRY